MGRDTKAKELLFFMLVSSIFFFAFTYKSFDSYFYFDDLDTLSWIHLCPTTSFIRDTFDFRYFQEAYFYRPSGSLLHSICFRLFGLNFLPYHLIAVFIHLFNVGCVYILISKLVPSRIAAWLGAFLFTFHLSAMQIYWFFYGTFDTFCAAFLLLSFLLYILPKGKFNFWYLLSLFCFVIALRSKEMPLSFPLVLISYEILIVRPVGTKAELVKRALRGVWPFLAICLLAGILKLLAAIKVDNASEYSMHFDAISLLGGLYHFVISLLSDSRVPLYVTLVLLLLLGILPILLKSRTLGFAYLFILVSLLPLLPLANRREVYRMYIPLIGVSLYIAELFWCFQQWIRDKGPRLALALHGLVILFVVLYSIRNWNLKTPIEDQYLTFSKENREFVELIAPHQAGEGGLYLYDSAPPVLAYNEAVFAVINLLFDDYTATVNNVSDCNKDIPLPVEHDVSCISYKNRTIRVWRAPTQKQPL